MKRLLLLFAGLLAGSPAAGLGVRDQGGVSAADATSETAGVVRAVAGYHVGPSDFVGLALSNPAAEPSAVQILSYPTGENGPSPAVSDQDIPAGCQLARLLPEFFSSPSAASEGWIEVRSDTGQVSAFAQFGDAQLGHLDGLTAVPPSPGPLFLTRVYEGSDNFRGQAVRTWVAVANPGSAPVTAEMILLIPADPAETLGPLREGASRALVQLEGKGSAIKSASQWFGTDVENGTVVVRILSGIGLVAATIVELPDQNTIFALNGLEASEETTLYSPQLANLPGKLFSSIRLINTDSSPRSVTLRAISDTGEVLPSPFTIEIPGNGYLEEDAGQLFRSHLGGQQAIVGSLLVEEEEGGGVIGDVVFGASDLAYAAANPLQSSTYREAILGHVANLPGQFFTGLALLNPGDDLADVEISVFAADGSGTGSTSIQLPAHGRISDVLSNLVAGAGGQVGGYILLRSTSVFCAQELFGTQDLSLLSAVSAVPLD